MSSARSVHPPFYRDADCPMGKAPLYFGGWPGGVSMAMRWERNPAPDLARECLALWRCRSGRREIDKGDAELGAFAATQALGRFHKHDLECRLHDPLEEVTALRRAIAQAENSMQVQAGPAFIVLGNVANDAEHLALLLDWNAPVVPRIEIEPADGGPSESPDRRQGSAADAALCGKRGERRQGFFARVQHQDKGSSPIVVNHQLGFHGSAILGMYRSALVDAGKLGLADQVLFRLTPYFLDAGVHRNLEIGDIKGTQAKMIVMNAMPLGRLRPVIAAIAEIIAAIAHRPFEAGINTSRKPVPVWRNIVDGSVAERAAGSIGILDNENETFGPLRRPGPLQRWRQVFPIASVFDGDGLPLGESRARKGEC